MRHQQEVECADGITVLEPTAIAAFLEDRRDEVALEVSLVNSRLPR